MTDLFLKVFNGTVAASWVVLAVMAARLLLKKAPRSMVCGLWALVALRLILGDGIQAPFSVIPSTELIPPASLYEQAPTIQSGIPVLDHAVNPFYSESLRPTPGTSVNPLQVWLAVGANVWMLGMAVMAIWAVISAWRIRLRVRESVPAEGNVYLCDRIDSPFIFGVFRPNIYLPSDLDDSVKAHVLAHERAHLARRDHLWKPFAFLLLTVNWFNPLMWAAYILLGRDIEMACDERVVRDLGTADKKSYSSALLECSVTHRMVRVCPLAFGEVGVEQRVRSVLNYKKPAFWAILIALALTMVLAVSLLTSPKTPPAEIRWDGMLYVQEGRSIRELPQDSVEAGTLEGIEPVSSNSQQSGYAVNLSEGYVGLRLYRAGDTLYLTEIGGEKWLPFVPAHSPADAYDMLFEKVQCQMVLKGGEISLKEFLPQSDIVRIRELLTPGGLEMKPNPDWDPMAMVNRFDHDIVLIIDTLDFGQQCLLIRREADWLMIYQDQIWRGSSWTFESPELDDLVASRQAELDFAREPFAPFPTDEDPLYLEYHTTTMLDISMRYAVPTINIGSYTTDNHWEWQTSVSYDDQTIHLMGRPFDRGDWMHIYFCNEAKPLSDQGFETEPITLPGGATGTLHHLGDPFYWTMITLNTARGQLYASLP